MKLQLLKDNVLVRIHESMETEGGIFLPEIARDRHDYRTGTVFAVGQDVREFKSGDDVVLDFGGNWTRIEGGLYAVVRERNILAVLEKEQEFVRLEGKALELTKQVIGKTLQKEVAGE